MAEGLEGEAQTLSDQAFARTVGLPPAEASAALDAARSAAPRDDPEVGWWIHRARYGDREAFERLILHFQERVWRRALYRLGDHDEAHDLAQEVFLTCFRKLHQFRGDAKFWSWLGRITDNHVKNRFAWLKRRGRDKTFSLDAPLGEDEDAPPGYDPPDPGAGPRKEAQDREGVEMLNRHMGALSADHREILLMRFSDGLAYEEIAERLEISLGTVKSRINRARAELRERMKDYLDEA